MFQDNKVLSEMESNLLEYNSFEIFFFRVPAVRLIEILLGKVGLNYYVWIFILRVLRLKNNSHSDRSKVRLRWLYGLFLDHPLKSRPYVLGTPRLF